MLVMSQWCFVIDLKALKEGVAYAKTKAGTPAETAAIYGIAGSLEGNQAVTEMVYGVFDHLYAL